MERSCSSITSFLHAGVVLWDTLIEAVSKVAKYCVHRVLGFVRFLEGRCREMGVPSLTPAQV